MQLCTTPMHLRIHARPRPSTACSSHTNQIDLARNRRDHRTHT